MALKSSSANASSLPLIMPRIIKAKHPPILKNSPFSHILKKQVELHNRYETLQTEALIKIVNSEQKFINDQKHFYDIVLRKREQHTQQLRKSIVKSVLAASVDRNKHIQAVTNNANIQRKKNEIQGEEHYKEKLMKITEAQYRKTSHSISSTPHKYSCSSLEIKSRKEELERNFSVRAMTELEQKQQRAMKNIGEVTERRIKKSKDLALRSIYVRDRYLTNCEEKQNSQLKKYVSSRHRFNERQKQVESMEVSLIQKKTKQEQQILQKTYRLKNQFQKTKREKILQQMNLKNQKLAEAQLKRQYRRNNFSILNQKTSMHVNEVLNKSRFIKEQAEQDKEAAVERKAYRFKQIEAYREESERIKQLNIGSRLKYIR